MRIKYSIYILLPLIQLTIFFLWGTSIYAATTIQRPPIYNLGLVGYWTLDGADTNWGSNTVTDRSGNGNTGTITNMSTTTSPATGKIGQALNFDGVDDYINIADINFGGTDPISTCAWTKINDINSGNGFDIIVGQSSEIVLWKNSGEQLEFVLNSFSTNDRVQTASAFVQNNIWYHVCGVYYSGGDMVIYVDGVEGGRVTPTGTYSNVSANFEISASTLSSMDGLIDDVRIYNRALSAQEIKQLYNAGVAKFNTSPTKVLTRGLVGYWTFDGADTNWGTNTVSDLSGNNRTGTITNMSTTSSPATGKYGQAFNFDGSDDYINIGSDLGLSSYPVTLAAWMKKGNTSNGTAVWLGVSSDDNRYIAIGYRGGYVMDARYNTGVASGEIISSVTDISSWHHVVGVFNSATSRELFVDGVSRGTDATSITFPEANNTSLGRAAGTLDIWYWNDRIDDVRVYNRALSVQEIKQLYNTGR